MLKFSNLSSILWMNEDRLSIGINCKQRCSWTINITFLFGFYSSFVSLFRFCFVLFSLYSLRWYMALCAPILALIIVYCWWCFVVRECWKWVCWKSLVGHGKVKLLQPNRKFNNLLHQIIFDSIRLVQFVSIFLRFSTSTQVLIALFHKSKGDKVFGMIRQQVLLFCLQKLIIIPISLVRQRFQARRWE